MNDDLSRQGGVNLERALHELKIAVATGTQVQKDLSTTIKELRGEIASTYVRQDVLSPTLDAIRDDVKSHGEWITWATRIVLALVIAAVVGFVISQGGAAPS